MVNSYLPGLAMPKHSPLKSMLDSEIIKIVEAGFVNKWLDDMNNLAQKYSRQVNKKIIDICMS